MKTLLLLMVFLAVPQITRADTLVQSYTETANDNYSGATRGQTIAITSDYTICSIEINATAPNSATISFKTTDVDHKPTGSVLSITTPGTYSSSYQQYILVTPLEVMNSTSISFYWSGDDMTANSSGTSVHSGDYLLGSGDGGTTWSADGSNSFLYKIYSCNGDGGEDDPTGTTTVSVYTYQDWLTVNLWIIFLLSFIALGFFFSPTLKSRSYQKLP